jgi:hypothetical protein
MHPLQSTPVDKLFPFFGPFFPSSRLAPKGKSFLAKQFTYGRATTDNYAEQIDEDEEHKNSQIQMQQFQTGFQAATDHVKVEANRISQMKQML